MFFDDDEEAREDVFIQAMDDEYEVSRGRGSGAGSRWVERQKIKEGRRGAVLGVARAVIGRAREETGDPLTLCLSFLP